LAREAIVAKLTDSLNIVVWSASFGNRGTFQDLARNAFEDEQRLQQIVTEAQHIVNDALAGAG
jgi:hypothetical protein